MMQKLSLVLTDVTKPVIKRANLADDIQPLKCLFESSIWRPIYYSDQDYQITWFASNAGISRETMFFIHDAVPFDMVLGKEFIMEQSVFVFDKAALALRHAKLTPGKTFVRLWRSLMNFTVLTQPLSCLEAGC
jgi:hypothetical protein